MRYLGLAESFARQSLEVKSPADLDEALTDIALRMGFSYYALTQHVPQVRTEGIRLHNYPPYWEAWVDARDLAPSDPVHRASHRTSVGFAWNELPRLIRLTQQDRLVLELARGHGLGEGFTVPAHVPGEANGSCSFVTAAGVAAPRSAFPLAQLSGAYAFECARRLWSLRGPVMEIPTLTDRQLDCVLWMARGKSDWEISRILGLSQETVSQHLKQARERYDVEKRTTLAVRVLFDGVLSFADVFRR